KCLEKEPGKRYVSARELAGDLERFLNHEPIHARRVRLWERAAKWARRRPTAAALAGVLLALALALPFAGVEFYAQLAGRRGVEQKRIDETRSEVLALLAQGRTASVSQNWKQAEVVLDRAITKIDAEPAALEDLRAAVEAVRAPVQERLAALD